MTCGCAAGVANAYHGYAAGEFQTELARAPKRLPESLEARDVAMFVADLATARDRAMTLLTLPGGLRAMEVRGLRLSDVDPLTLRVSRSCLGGTSVFPSAPGAISRWQSCKALPAARHLRVSA